MTSMDKDAEIVLKIMITGPIQNYDKKTIFKLLNEVC